VPRAADVRADRAPYPHRVRTARLVLRRWEEAESQAYAAIWCDPQVAGAVHPGRTLDRDYALRVFASRHANWSLHGFGDWAVQDRASGELVGTVGIGRTGYVPGFEGATDLGWLLRPAYWGRGLASEAARAAMDAAFAHLALDELIAIIDPGNARSAGVARRLGMQPGPEVRFRHPHHGVRSVSVYTIDRGRWADGHTSAYG
jgi:RimJ/RimL family protein N-acetyltransferase